MTILDIETFLTIVKSGSLTKAAELLYITQPTLTYRIRAMEKELGYELFIRRPGIRHIELTPKGEIFVSIAEQWASLWGTAKNLKNMDVLEHLRIVCVESILMYVMDSVCRKFMQKHNNIQLSLKPSYSNAAYQDVSAREADFGIINIPQHARDISCFLAFQEDMVFACRRGAGYPDTIDPRGLESRDAIYVPWSLNYQMWYQYWFTGKSPYKFYIQNVSMLKNFIMIGNSWSILPATVANSLSQDQDIEIHTIQNGPEARPNYFITNRDHQPPYYSELYQLIHEELASQSNVALYF